MKNKKAQPGCAKYGKVIVNHEALVNAIIMQAVKDYRMNLEILSDNSQCPAAMLEKWKILRFFRSKWFKALTDIDPEKLINQLNLEV